MKIINHNPKDYLAISFIFFISCLLSYGVGVGMPTYLGLPIVFICMIFSFLIHWIAFIPSYFFKTEKFYDISGTLAYLIVIGSATLLTKKLLGEQFFLRSYIVSVLVIIWALRLGIFLFIRVLKNGEDRRFREPMKSFSKFLLWWSMSALWVFLTTLNAVTLIINNYKTTHDYFFFFGISLWILGFILELISDEQKRRFKKDVKNKNLFISSGLWSISRHPNYLGEIVIWVGVFVMSIPVLHGLQFLSILSPIFVYFLLTRISGINLLEESADLKWGDLEDYKRYKKNTPILFPYKT